MMHESTAVLSKVCPYNYGPSGFGGQVVSMLASGTQVRKFKTSGSHLIFQAKKSSACLPLEGK
jgi:hypothetical protein